MVFLDTNPIIYFVEQPPVWGPKAVALPNAVQVAGEAFGVTNLVRMECLVGPLKSGDTTLLGDFDAFFSLPDLQVQALILAVCERAATIRAKHGFKPLDSLHLAAAVEHGCARFLTNDTRLSGFPDIPVEVLT
jgi:predicted nucleic acid-binding protein